MRKVAVVTWHDPFSVTDAHISANAERLRKPYVRHSTGWLIHRRPLVIAQTWDEDATDGELVETLTIPNAIVKKLVVLEVPDG